MTVLLEIREKIKEIYGKTDAFLVPLLKFLVAVILLNTINSRMGYMGRIDSGAIVLVAALACSFLPNGIILMFAALFSLLHMYELSLVAAMVGLVIYLVIYLLYLRFTPKEALVVAITPLLFSMKLAYVIPIVMGLVGTPVSAVSVACGILAYYFLSIVTGNATNLAAMGEADALGQLKFLVDALLDNKGMLVFMMAFAVTIVVVYIIRRLAVAHAWTIAMAAGVVVNFVVLLVGDLKFQFDFKIGSAILGSIIALLAAKVLEFFRFCLDYGRTENVQFEDDEYYYFVKAVPKMSVPQPTRSVKKINQTKGRSKVVTGYTKEDDTYLDEEDYLEEEYLGDEEEYYSDEEYYDEDVTDIEE